MKLMTSAKMNWQIVFPKQLFIQATANLLSELYVLLLLTAETC